MPGPGWSEQFKAGMKLPVRAKLVRVPDRSLAGVAAWDVDTDEPGDSFALLLPVTFEDGELVVHGAGQHLRLRQSVKDDGVFCDGLLALAQGAKEE